MKQDAEQDDIAAEEEKHAARFGFKGRRIVREHTTTTQPGARVYLVQALS